VDEVVAPTQVRAEAAGEVPRPTDGGATRYARHEPEATALHRVVKAHLETFVRFAAARSGRALPRYVVEEFRAYLRCGSLAHGFARARCAGCGHERLVAFSCKQRGVCPSCGGRRMSATAADVVDRVLPEVPLRQWVLSVPFALRVRLAADPTMLNTVSRVFWEEMRRWYRAASGVARGADVRVEGGAITFVQRFGGALNLNVHFHVLGADGVWRCVSEGSTPVFVAVRAPTRDDLAGVVARVVARVAREFARTTEDEADGAEDDALAGCQRVALARGSYAVVRDDGAVEASEAVDTARFGRRPPKAQVAEAEGFNLHASVVIGAKDGVGRERLLRYVAAEAAGRARGDPSHHGADGVHGAPRGAGAAATASAGALPRGVRTPLAVACGGGPRAAPAGVGASGESVRREGDDSLQNRCGSCGRRGRRGAAAGDAERRSLGRSRGARCGGGEGSGEAREEGASRVTDRLGDTAAPGVEHRSAEVPEVRGADEVHRDDHRAGGDRAHPHAPQPVGGGGRRRACPALG